VIKKSTHEDWICAVLDFLVGLFVDMHQPDGSLWMPQFPYEKLKRVTPSEAIPGFLGGG
jgi:hypothetical protein